MHPDDIPPEKGDTEALERYFTVPEVVIPRWKRLIENLYYGGEAFPVMLPVSMVAILGNYLGCPMHFVDMHTVWSDPVIDDWEQRPTFRCDPGNPYWRMTERMLKAAVEECDGYFILGPDLNGPTQILANLRGPDRLSMDFYDNPQHIKPALAEINQAWYDFWRACTDITQQVGGYFHWMGIWSDRPSIDLQSDYSCMISKEMFDEHFLPSIEEQTRMVERTIYHLDGPGAIRHLDSLLALEHLDGIQWVPGAGEKQGSAWLPLLKKIQDAGKLVYVYALKDDVENLVKGLDPAALMIHVVPWCHSIDEVHRLLDDAVRWSR